MKICKCLHAVHEGHACEHCGCPVSIPTPRPTPRRTKAGSYTITHYEREGAAR